MRITFIGTADGVPQPNRKVAATLIEVGDRKYFVDAGCDIINAITMRNIRPERINAIFITHMHSDHTDGLIHFIGLTNWYYTEANPIVYIPHPEALEGMTGWWKCVGNIPKEGLDFREVSEGTFFDDGLLKVTAMKTRHLDKSFSFLLEAEGKKVFMSGDMYANDGDDFDFTINCEKYGLYDLDLAVGECAHFDAMCYLGTLRKFKPKQSFFNHYSPKFEETCWHLKNSLAGEIPVTLATDDMIVEL